VVPGLFLLLLTLWDVFETIVLPRRVSRTFRLVRIFYLSTWRPWKAVGKLIRNETKREDFLSVYGPLTMLSLLALWAVLLIFSFALLQWGVSSPLAGVENFSNYLFRSGLTLFTFGSVEAMTLNHLGRIILVIQAGTGFGVLALVIGYLPVLWEAFSRRERNISLLDAKAGSPPSAAEMLSRHSERIDKLETLLEEWEEWAAELLESHITLPVLCLYRSQHDNQSWIGSLTTILDTSSLILTILDGGPKWQAQFTFAMARHALVDLAQVFNATPRRSSTDRLSSDEFARLCDELRENGLPLVDSVGAEDELRRLRMLYEPFSAGLAELLLLRLPPWTTPPHEVDNWRKSAWQIKAPIAIKHSMAQTDEETKQMG
jgi:hypothetical protein